MAANISDSRILCLLAVSMVMPMALGGLCPPWQRTNISHVIFHGNDSLEDVDESLIYPPGTYWTEIEERRTIRLYGCPCKLGMPCLRKCCAWNQAMDNETLECIPHGGGSKDWFHPILSTEPNYTEQLVDRGHFGLVYGNYCFGYLLEPNEYPEDKFYIDLKDGKLNIPGGDRFGLDTSHYCLEYLPVFDVYLPYVCFDQLLEQNDGICDDLRYTLYPLGMAISFIFLIISLFIYATTAELRNLHGKCLMCHIASLLVAYLFLAIVQSSGSSLGDNVCTAFGFVIYFALLCTFFWLNIMCIDIYVAFSSFIPPRLHSTEMKKFLTYVAYAWGLPFIIIIVTAIMEFHPNISKTYLRPEFKTTCWFYSRDSRMAYFIAPIGIICLCNLVLFILTAVNIYKVKRETSILQRGSSARSREDKNRMKLYIKLSFVMGVSWVLEIISYIIGGSKCIWLFTDLINTLQGFFIFLIFVCKRNVKEMMKKRFRKFLAKFRNAVSPRDEPCGDVDVDAEQSTSRSGATASSSLPSVELTVKTERIQPK